MTREVKYHIMDGRQELTGKKGNARIDKQHREEKRKIILNRIQEMCYFDDEFMAKCFED